MKLHSTVGGVKGNQNIIVKNTKLGQGSGAGELRRLVSTAHRRF